MQHCKIVLEPAPTGWLTPAPRQPSTAAPTHAPSKAALSAVVVATTIVLSLLAGCANPSAVHAGHGQVSRADPGHLAAAPMADDARVPVAFPDMMKSHTLANMRDHLLALAEIQDRLARGAFDEASDIAEQRLGLSSLALHGAHEVAAFMPQGMQDAGTAMHRSASRFALVARDASATGELKAALAALAAVSQTCVGCHAGYRLR
jgi:hypothetical protein